MKSENLIFGLFLCDLFKFYTENIPSQNVYLLYINYFVNGMYFNI